MRLNITDEIRDKLRSPRFTNLCAVHSAILAIIAHLEAEPSGSGESIAPTFAEALTNQIPEASAEDMDRMAWADYDSVISSEMTRIWVRRAEYERRAKERSHQKLREVVEELAVLKAQRVIDNRNAPAG